MSLFADLDTRQLHILTAAIGSRFVCGSEPYLRARAQDDMVSPQMLHAAIVRAHLLGAASAIVSGLKSNPLVFRDLDLITTEAAAMFFHETEEMRRRT